YFSEDRRRTLVQRFYDSLEPGGYLFLGHSESISKMPVKFQAIVLNDCILYRKPTAEELRKSELVMEGAAAFPTAKPSSCSSRRPPSTCSISASTSAFCRKSRRAAKISSGSSSPRTR